MAGYQQKRLHRTCNGGGISQYVRDSVKFKPRDDVSSDNLELICVEIQPPKNKSHLVVSWNRPPSDPVGSFSKLEKVLSYLDLLQVSLLSSQDIEHKERGKAGTFYILQCVLRIERDL